MSDLKQQRNSGKIIEAIVEKLLPWHRIKWLSVGLLSQTVRIRVVGMNVAVSLCSDESLFQVQFLEPATNPEDLYQIQRLEAILNGAKRDDAGNLTCGVDKGSETPSYSVPAVEEPLPDPGKGYRLLNKGEELKPGDEYYDKDGQWEPSARANENFTKQSGSDVYRRKIETANPSETPNSSIPDPGEGYRTPHPGDAGKRIEVRDSEDLRSGDARWVERTLVAVIALPVECYEQSSMGEFVCSVEGKDAAHICHAWRYARIRKEPSQTANPSEAPNRWAWIPKVGDIVRINSPERVNHGRVGVVVTKRARVCDVASEVSGKWKTWGLTANELQLIGFPE